MKRRLIMLFIFGSIMVSVSGCGKTDTKVGEPEVSKKTVQTVADSVTNDTSFSEEVSTYTGNVYVNIGDYSVIYLDGKELRLPCTVNDIISLGLETDEDLNEILDPGMNSSLHLYNEIYSLSLYAFNLEDGPKAFGECTVCEVEVAVSSVGGYKTVDDDSIIDLQDDFANVCEAVGSVKEYFTRAGYFYAGDRDSNTKMTIGDMFDFNDETTTVSSITLLYNKDNETFDDYYEDCVNLNDMLGNWHKQDFVEFDIATVMIDSNWTDYYNLNGQKICYGEKVSTTPFFNGYDTVSLEPDLVAKYKMNPSSQLAFNALDAFDEMGAEYGDTVENVIENSVHENNTLTNVYFNLNYERPEDYKDSLWYVGDCSITGFYLGASLSAEVVRAGDGTSTIGIGNKLSEVKSIVGDGYTEVWNYNDSFLYEWTCGNRRLSIVFFADRTGKTLSEGNEDCSIDDYLVGNIGISTIE